MALYLRIIKGDFLWNFDRKYAEMPSIKSHIKIDPEKSLTIQINRFPVTIGRFEPIPNQAYFPEVCLATLPTSIGRQHALIYQQPDGFYISDLHSKNGTLLRRGSLPIMVGEDGVKIEHGDHVMLAPGPHYVEFEVMLIPDGKKGWFSGIFSKLRNSFSRPASTSEASKPKLDEKAYARIVILISQGTKESLRDARILLQHILGRESVQEMLGKISRLQELKEFRASEKSEERKLYQRVREEALQGLAAYK